MTIAQHSRNVVYNQTPWVGWNLVKRPGHSAGDFKFDIAMKRLEGSAEYLRIPPEIENEAL